MIRGETCILKLTIIVYSCAILYSSTVSGRGILYSFVKTIFSKDALHETNLPAGHVCMKATYSKFLSMTIAESFSSRNSDSCVVPATSEALVLIFSAPSAMDTDKHFIGFIRLTIVVAAVSLGKICHL